MEFILQNWELIVFIGVAYYFYMSLQTKQKIAIAEADKKVDDKLDEIKDNATVVAEEAQVEAVATKLEKVEELVQDIEEKKAEIKEKIEDIDLKEAIEKVQDIIEEEEFVDIRFSLIVNTPEEFVEHRGLIKDLAREFGPFKVNLTYPINKANGFPVSTRQNKFRKCNCGGGLLYKGCHWPDWTE